MMRKIGLFFRRHYLFILFIGLLPVMRNAVEKNPRGVIWSDMEGYYVYLPALFNLHDFHAVPEGSMNARKNEKGEVVMKYTCGVAFFEAPFFAVARLWNDAQGIDKKDIYHDNYARAVALSGFCFGFLGLFFLKKGLLARGFGENTTMLTVLSVFGGTNLFYYTMKEMGASHVYSFSLLAVLAWFLPRFYRQTNWKNALILGAMSGWIILIRPTNIVTILFVLLYDVYSIKDWTNRVVFWWRNIRLAAVAAFGAFSVLFVQMAYWKEMTGHWVRYSYDGESFIYWNQPKILAVLFDPQNGLFLYSPMVLLMVLGIFTGWRNGRVHSPALALIFALSTYIFAGWWAWWFGGAFGHRSYVELYALFAYPLAWLIQRFLHAKRAWIRYTGVAVILFLIYFGVKLAFLYQTLPKPWDGADWRWNWEKYAWVLSYLFKF